jgi:hypothetical protein
MVLNEQPLTFSIIRAAALQIAIAPVSASMVMQTVAVISIRRFMVLPLGLAGDVATGEDGNGVVCVGVDDAVVGLLAIGFHLRREVDAADGVVVGVEGGEDFFFATDSHLFHQRKHCQSS